MTYKTRTSRFNLGTATGAMGASLLALALLAPTSVEAQSRGRGGGVPPGHLPPPGECRVWHDDRPPGHQPPPTSCGAAQRDAYRYGGRVIYGGGERRDDRWRGERRDRERDGRNCTARERRERECDDSPVRYPDSRYPDDGYPSRYPDRGRLPSWEDIILDRLQQLSRERS